MFPSNGPARVLGAAAIAALISMGCQADDDSMKGRTPVTSGIPAIAAVTPDSGRIDGGEDVSIVAVNFSESFLDITPIVFFGSIPSPRVSAVSANEILAETPAVTAPGPVRVDVVSVGAIVESAGRIDGYTYLEEMDAFGLRLPVRGGSVIFVVERSGSMAWAGGTWTDRFGNPATGSRWDRAVDGILGSISSLPAPMEFNVYSYACNVDSASPGIVPADPPNLLLAETYLMGRFPYGGTSDGPSLSKALEERSNLTIVFVTDGQPNCGAPGLTGHKNLALSSNTQGATIHVIGILTTGIFRDYLIELAEETGGIYTDIR